MCNFPNIALMFSLNVLHVNQTWPCNLFPEFLLFSAVTLLILSDKVSSEIRRKFLVTESEGF